MTHFGIFDDVGESGFPVYTCEQTLCGYTSEKACEYATDDWSLVTCKKCLSMKSVYMDNIKQQEEIIADQMGDMAEFMCDKNWKDKE